MTVLPANPLSTTSTLVAVQRDLAEALLFHPELYRPSGCASNVLNFTQGYVPPDCLRDAHVVSVMSVRVKTFEDFCKRSALIQPARSLFKGTEWLQHTLLVVGGRVYDFDYSGLPGRDATDYAQDMFAGALTLWDYDAVVIPSAEFLDSRKSIIHWLWNAGYPRISLANCVSELRERYGRQEDFADLSERSVSYEEWGIMDESNLHRTAPWEVLNREFMLEYAAGASFCLDKFLTLLERWTRRLQRDRPGLQDALIRVRLENRRDFEQLALLAEERLRSLGINGSIRVFEAKAAALASGDG